MLVIACLLSLYAAKQFFQNCAPSASADYFSPQGVLHHEGEKNVLSKKIFQFKDDSLML